MYAGRSVGYLTGDCETTKLAWLDMQQSAASARMRGSFALAQSLP